MVKYEYRPELEVFKRVDNRGPALKFNIVEARRIQTMLELGNKIPTIYSKIDFVNNVSMTNLRTFVNNLNDGNINLDGDYPAPKESIYDLDVEARLSRLESDMMEFKQILYKQKENESVGNKVKSWIGIH